MKRNFTLVLLAVLVLYACNKKRIFGDDNFFSDGFENATAVDSLLLEDNTRWQGSQLTKNGNHFELDTFSHSGNQSLKATAEVTKNGASKTSIFRNKMAFYEGQTVYLSAWYFIPNEKDLRYLFLMDLEESSVIGAGPGIRVGLDDDHFLFLERKKYLEKDVHQTAEDGIKFPRNEWVKITLEVLLSQKKKGTIKVFQNNQLVVEVNNTKTLPTDKLYFIQGTAGLYTNIEFGITANSIDNATTLYIDDVEAGLK